MAAQNSASGLLSSPMNLNNDSLPTSGSPQDNSGRNSLNSPPLEQDTLLVRIFYFFCVVFLLILVSCLDAQLWGVIIGKKMKMKIIMDEYEDWEFPWYLVSLIICELICPVMGVYMIEALSNELLPLFVDEEEEVEMEAPSWLSMPAIPAAGCGLFLLLSGLLCWLTNNSLEKIFRPRPPLEFPVSPFHLNTIYPSLCCYGVAISTALAIILAYVTTLTSRAIAATNGVSDVEMNHLPPSPAAVGTEITKVKTRFRVFETSRFRSVRASILLCNRLVSFLHLQPADE